MSAAEGDAVRQSHRRQEKGCQDLGERCAAAYDDRRYRDKDDGHGACRPHS